MKFGRNYRITIELEGGEQIIIEPPLTIKFNIQRNNYATVNTMNLQIMNLGANNRSRIFQDRFDFIEKRRITVEAGYGQLTTIFHGEMFQAYSARSGEEIITTIVARDGFGDLSTSFTKATYPAGTSLKELIGNLMGDFPTLEQGTIGDFQGDFKRPVAVNGNTFTLLETYTKNNIYVDLGKVNALQGNEFIQGSVVSFNATQGLLETPRREGAFLTITTLFEPSIMIDQLINYESSVFPEYNGQYKVIGVQHDGIISEAVNGECKSTFSLLLGQELFGRYKEA